MTLIHPAEFEAELAKAGIVKLADVPISNLALWITSEGPRNETDPILSAVARERRMTAYSKSKRKAKGWTGPVHASTAESGGPLSETTSASGVTLPHGMIPGIAGAFVPSVTETSNPSRPRSSSKSIRCPLCGRNGKRNFTRKGIYLVCTCGLYQPIE